MAAMNQSVTGDAIGTDTLAAQIAFGQQYLAEHPITPEHKFFTEAENMELMLGMAKLAGNAVITHAPGWDPVETAPNTGAGLDRPMPAIAQQIVGGTFVGLWLKTGTAATAWTLISGDSGVFPGFYPGPMAPVGVDFAGDSGLAADGNHSHPLIDAEVAGRYLFPCYVPDPLLRPTARAMLPHGEGIMGFIQIAGISTWEFDGYPGQLYGVDASYGNTIAFVDGDLCFIYTPVPYGTDAARFGLFEVLDCGAHWVPTPEHPETPMLLTTKPIIRRHSSANTPSGLCHGMTFQVDMGAYYQGEFFTLNNADPIVVDETELDFTHGSSYTENVRHLSLSAQQLVSEGASTTSLTTSATSPGTSTPLSYAHFPTLSGTPGLAEIPAGPWTIDAEGIHVDAAPTTGAVTLVCEILVYSVDGNGDPNDLIGIVVTAESPPITNTTVANISFQANQAAPYTSSPSYIVVPRFSMHNTSGEVHTLTFTYNSASRRTRIRTTFVMAVAGTTDHQKLSGLNADVAAGDDKRHPWSALSTGRAHFSEGTATLAAGVLTIPTGFNRARLVVTGTDEIIGIETAGFLNSGDVELLVLAYETFTLWLRHNHAVTGTVYALGLPPNPSGSGKLVGADYKITNQAWLAFRLDTTSRCWRMSRLPVGSSEVGS